MCLQCKPSMVLVVVWKCGVAFLLQSPQNHSMRNLAAVSPTQRILKLEAPMQAIEANRVLYSGFFTAVHPDTTSFTLERQGLVERGHKRAPPSPVGA